MTVTPASGGYRKVDACTCTHEYPDPANTKPFRRSRFRGIDEAWLWNTPMVLK